jgi:hypothetical protein
MAKQIDKVFIIDNISSSEFLWLGASTRIGDWNKIENTIDEQLNYLKSNKSDSPLNVSVRQFLKRDKKLESILIEWDKKILREKLKSQNDK